MRAALPPRALNLVYRDGLQGMGYSRQAMGAGLAELIARVLVAFGFVGRYGFQAVCFANPTAWLFADAILLVLYRRVIHRLNQRMPESAPEDVPATAQLEHAAAK